MKDNQRGLAEFLARCLEDTQQQPAITAPCGPEGHSLAGDKQERQGAARVTLFIRVGSRDLGSR